MKQRLAIANNQNWFFFTQLPKPSVFLGEAFVALLFACAPEFDHQGHLIKRLLAAAEKVRLRSFECGSAMRIRIVAHSAPLFGTPTEIVQRMNGISHQRYNSSDEYINNYCQRFMPTASVSGDSEGERCFSFLQNLIRGGRARIEVHSPEHIDKFTVHLLRKVFNISQERMAQQIGVSYATVNRWESGAVRPKSLLIAQKLGEMASAQTAE